MTKTPRHFLDIDEMPLGELRNIMDASRAMKAKLDPRGILNPGVLI